MSLPDVLALNAYWKHSPPVHVSVARYLGIKPGAGSHGAARVNDEWAPRVELEQTFGAPRPFVPPIPIRRM